MEEKNFSSDSEIEMEFENESETEMIKSDYFRDKLREKITNCIHEERKKSKKLDKYYMKLRLRNLVML